MLCGAQCSTHPTKLRAAKWPKLADEDVFAALRAAMATGPHQTRSGASEPRAICDTSAFSCLASLQLGTVHVSVSRLFHTGRDAPLAVDAARGSMLVSETTVTKTTYEAG